MKLATIWSIPTMTLRERLRRTRDWAAMEVAVRLPHRVRYWATLIEIGKATRGSHNIPAIPLCVILNELEAPKNLS